MAGVAYKEMTVTKWEMDVFGRLLKNGKVVKMKKKKPKKRTY